ncbi:tripartite tricarboxylate transporter TctB family protein [Falsiroseomonas sp. HC035]|uniref:tripartite tricarboxylate transporter TctB family protein n=1 Tax=Falsiroseomonas sp. HC035 TaxID=3390999 RepID=UPI003D32253A
MAEARRRREPGETLFGFVLLLLGLSIVAEGVRLQGLEAVSTPGVMPLAAGAVMAASALAIMLRNRALTAPESGFATRIAPRDIAVSVALIAAYMLVLEPLGFHLATLGFLTAIIWFLRGGGFGFALLLALVSVVVVHVVFRMIFTVVLPQGWLLRGVLPPGLLQ